jgi:hypothetical protein
MFQRHKLERSEGKSYQDAGVSDQMKALNKSFGVLHGVSSLLNLCSVLALGFHGLVSLARFAGSKTLLKTCAVDRECRCSGLLSYTLLQDGW